jgi:hypothetical protein
VLGDCCRELYMTRMTAAETYMTAAETYIYAIYR